MFEELFFSRSTLLLLLLWNYFAGERALQFQAPSPPLLFPSPPPPPLHKQAALANYTASQEGKGYSLPDINYKPWLGLWPLLNPINSPDCLNIINQKKNQIVTLNSKLFLAGKV